MRLHVALTPTEVGEAPVAVVVDVLRATSTRTQALHERLGDGVLAGERRAVRIPGFDAGVSPREFLEPRGETAIEDLSGG